jgi:hypothetical protein
MINVCPIGRNCSQEERDAFALYDAVCEEQAEVMMKFIPRNTTSEPNLWKH